MHAHPYYLNGVLTDSQCTCCRGDLDTTGHKSGCGNDRDGQLAHYTEQALHAAAVALTDDFELEGILSGNAVLQAARAYRDARK